MLHFNTLQRDTLGLLKAILKQPELAELRLVGGTALALLLGHRESIDLDFFGRLAADTDLVRVVDRCGTVVIDHLTDNVKVFMVNGVKTDFVTYNYAWLAEPVISDGVRLAALPDIAAMKLEAITNRGSRKDFVDLFFLLNHYSLDEMLAFYKKKYPAGSKYSVLRSLAYFDDAEDDPDPVMLQHFEWNEAKERIMEAVKEYAPRM